MNDSRHSSLPNSNAYQHLTFVFIIPVWLMNDSRHSGFPNSNAYQHCHMIQQALKTHIMM
jgi:hypothetical protein